LEGNSLKFVLKNAAAKVPSDNPARPLADRA
jgi:hypothetical protein